MYAHFPSNFNESFSKMNQFSIVHSHLELGTECDQYSVCLHASIVLLLSLDFKLILASQVELKHLSIQKIVPDSTRSSLMACHRKSPHFSPKAKSSTRNDSKLNFELKKKIPPIFTHYPKSPPEEWTGRQIPKKSLHISRVSQCLLQT